MASTVPADHAERREHADHQRVPRDARCRIRTGATCPRSRPARSPPGTSPPPRAATGPGRSQARGRTGCRRRRPTRPPTAPARKPEQDGGELVHPIRSLIATATSSAANSSDTPAAREALLERGARDHAGHRGNADQHALGEVDVAVRTVGDRSEQPDQDDRGERRAGRHVLASSRTRAPAAARSPFLRRRRTAR